MASLAAATAAGTPFERRLGAEWALLGELAGRNPARLCELHADDTTLRLTLSGTPARMLAGRIATEHPLRIEYPRFFPALPLELYLHTPVFHPNVHPETGFVCLWDRHSPAHTAEDALHKTAAILGWTLFALHPRHVMQPAAAALTPQMRLELAVALGAAPLAGVRAAAMPPAPPATPRRRLS